jgi:hypothetical protein
MPYVQAICRAVAARELELERVRQFGHEAVDPEGMTARELLLHLDLQGPATVERLCRTLCLETRLVQAFACALERRGWITLGRTARGSVVVRPVSAAARQRAVAVPFEPGADAAAG